MFEKAKAFYNVFRSGQSVANPVAWKTGQITVSLLAGFLGALVATAKVFGYDIPLTDGQLVQIGGAVLAVYGMFNSGVTVASTDKLGLPAAAPASFPDLHDLPATPVVRPVSQADIAEAKEYLKRDHDNSYIN